MKKNILFFVKNLGFIGNINPDKDIENLMYACNILKSKVNINFILLIIGKIPKKRFTYYESLKKLLKKKEMQKIIFFINGTDNPNKYYNLFDIFVLPSKSEGTPLVILEAMAKGLPIVSTNVGGIPEQITNLKSGILVPPRNPKKLAEAIEILLKNNYLAQKFALKANQDVKKEFALKSYLKNHLFLYLKILKY